MANPKFKYDDNTPGSFFVDTECIACDTCAGIAPKHFQLVNDNDHAVVFRQPKADTELKQCMEALEACPVDAIGRQG